LTQYAVYRKAAAEAGLSAKIADATERLADCRLCPRECGVNRLKGETGFCGVGRWAVVASAHPHFGEEAPVVGVGGSGTIFFSSCNLQCVFCQNFEISRMREGTELSAEDLGRVMIRLQESGCGNINLVTPSHVVPMILEALECAEAHGLNVPLVYNTGGYDSVDTLRLLDGIVDIYMPDIKFMDAEVSKRYMDATDYPDVVKAAVKEMSRQVGDLALDERGSAVRGVLARHLVMPGGLAGTREVMEFLASEISPNTYVNIMDQYRPCGDAHRYPEIARSLSSDEHGEALKIAEAVGIKRLDQRARAGGMFRLRR
jgi:putative pyruvate formate lyase activating enzyme